ncbi:MAG: helix-turn-helix domain-containing protein [Candidatus Micrarchaeales archaeon]
MDRESILRRYSKLLERYGFSETYAYGLRSSFDIISKKREKVMILKFVENIDSLSTNEAETLKKLDNFFDADVFVVFKNYKGKNPDKDTVFTRHGVDCLSYSTLEDVLEGKRTQRAQRFIKRKYKINSFELKRLRKMQNLSARSLSQLTKVSKDTIYRYEKGDSYATQPKLKKLESFFNTTLEEISIQHEKTEHNYKYQRVNESLELGFLEVGSSPFQMLGKKRFRYEIGGDADHRTMKKVASFYKRFSEVLNEDHPFFVTSRKTLKDNFDGIPVLTEKELKKIKEEKELLDIIESRTRS